MPYKKEIAKKRKQDLTENLRWYLETGAHAKGDIRIFILASPSGEPPLTKLWLLHQGKIMADWIKKSPCSRPWAWWKIAAPKEAVPGWDHERWNSAQRRRLGGIGDAMHEVTCSWGGFDRGIAESWAGAELFGGVAIDENDPPCFESETAYLQRRDLLSPQEKKYVAGHPELMEPEKIFD